MKVLMKTSRCRYRTSLAALILGLLGAVSVEAATITVTSTADAGGTCPGATCTLRQAIATAVSSGSGDTINFAAGITMINLTSAELLINKNLTISGPGANLLTVQRAALNAPDFRIFHVASGNVNISGLTIANGRVSNTNGGGILNGSTLTVTGCTISGNVAIDVLFPGTGGGIYNSGTLTITNSTISGNGATEFGGGIYNVVGTVNLTNSTVSGNSGFGGGIYNRATVTITNSTISGNSGVGIINDTQNAGTVNARNTIIAKNIGNSDFNGTLASQGYNLIGNTSGTTITGTTTGNQPNVDPLLGPLQDNGGPTFTQALLSGSTAIEGGNSSGSITDQRGFARPVDTPAILNATGGDGSDIGAYEVQADQLPGCGNTLVTTNSDSGPGSLRFMIANQCGGETITFASSVVSPINLASDELLINKAMTIRGPGANLMTVQRSATAGSNFRIFNFNFGNYNAAISGLTISNGYLGQDSNGGGGIFNQTSGVLTVTGCAISGNRGGGGLSNIGAITLISPSQVDNRTGTVNLVNSTVSNNIAGNGGGIYTLGPLNITNSTISGNQTFNSRGGGSSTGGGIYGASIIGTGGPVTITNTTIANNTTGLSPGSGGGVTNGGITLVVRNSIIALNTSTSGPDISGALSSQGFNFIGNNAGAAITPAQFSDQIGTSAAPKDPLLGPLQNNGGPTQTLALMTGSTAIDKGQSSGLTTDQRGQPRRTGSAKCHSPVISDADVAGLRDLEEILFRPSRIQHRGHGR